MTIHDYSCISTKENVNQVASGVLNIRCRDRKLYLSHDYSKGSLEPGDEQIDASSVQIQGSSGTTATDLVIAREVLLSV